jgi:hypothetical protein
VQVWEAYNSPFSFRLDLFKPKKGLAPRLTTNHSENLKTLFASSLDVSACAEVAQPGRALDSLPSSSEGEAEDRVVAGSNPALGTTIIWLFTNKFPLLLLENSELST